MAVIHQYSSSSFSWFHLLALPAAAAALAFIYCIFIAVYRLFFHPLAKYPGPVVAKVTAWRDVYHAYRGDKHLDFHQLHQKYGPVVRYGPNTLSFNHPAALKAIYGHKANVRKSDFYLSFPVAPGVFSTHTAIDRAAHARKRRVMSHAFSEAALKSVEDYVLGHVRTYIQQLAGGTSNAWTEPRDVATWSAYLGFDVMGDLSFGKSFGMLEGDNPEVRRATYLLSRAAKRHNVTGPMPWLHQSRFDRLLFRKINQDRDQYMAFSKKQVGERMNSDVYNSSRRDFFYYLLNAKDPESGQGFAKGELWGESNTLIIAGSDTTSTTITSTIFYLLHNPIALATVQKEIREKFGSVEDIRAGPVLNSCTYLRACIDEAMRMSPPVSAILPRFTLDGGLDIPGLDIHIPAGVGVGCPIYGLHHNTDYVPDPFTYRPERWILGQSATEESLDALHSVFNPFSIGPRGCIGKPMAYLELTLTLGRLLWGYEMRLAPGDQGRMGEGNAKLGNGRERENEFQMWDIFVSDKEGPVAQFMPREWNLLHE
ncbi:cytochrome P450 [Rhizodiscina lignyota]|uniref:Cytochrome P450 n=1 Tax=Rhizodiscina lignyota TaxID=1504668 RepID=A0A9P4I3Q5_9PEZI|nr:cytochrome P450 [Rhizodiscina lignyota]